MPKTSGGPRVLSPLSLEVVWPAASSPIFHLKLLSAGILTNNIGAKRALGSLVSIMIKFCPEMYLMHLCVYENFLDVSRIHFNMQVVHRLMLPHDD